MAEGQYKLADAQPVQGTGKYSLSQVDAPEEKQGFLGALWEGVGGKALVDLMGGASRDPAAAQKSIDTLKAIGHGFLNEGPRIMKELDSAGEAVKRGDWERVAHHLAGAAPLIGAPVQQAGSEVEKGDYAAAAGHTAALFAPVVAGKAPGVAAALADTDAGAAVIGGAKGAGKALIETKPLTVKGVEFPVPVTAASAAAGGQAASMMGLPRTVGTVAGAAAPVIRGAIKGGKAALAERLAKAVEAARAQKVATDAASIPPDVMAELTRDSEAPGSPPQAQPIPGQKMLPAAPSVTQMPAAPDASFVRGVPAQYPAKSAPGMPTPAPTPAPQALLGPGPVITPPPPDASFVRAVPATYPGAPPPVEAPAGAPKPPSLAQQEAWMGQKGAPPTEAPQSRVTAAGETKSPQLRAAEITGANRTAKAKRFAETLYNNGEGLTSQDLSETAPGRTSQMQRDAKVSHGWGDLADAMGENEPSKDTVAEIIHYVREMEKAKSSIPGSRESKVTAPAKRADQMTRAELAKRADLSPDATTQEIMEAMAREMGKK